MRFIFPRHVPIVGALVALAACGDGGGVTQPSTGSAQVTVTTIGRVLDRDGYTLSVDGGTPVVVLANHVHSVAKLTPGTHTLTFGGVADNCQAKSSASRIVQVVAGAAAPVQFEVECAANRMAYQALQDGKNGIFVQRLDGTGRTLLVPSAVSARFEWSPDGYRLAYVPPADSTGIRHIHIVDVDSGTIKKMPLAGLSTVAHPAWSPDGTRLALAGRPSASVQPIYSVRTDGTDLKLLTPESAVQSMPVWSPDGTRVAYLREAGPMMEVWVVNADGTGRYRVTEHSFGGYTHLDWSPDGSRLVYSRLRNGQWDLFSVRLDGTNETQLTASAATDEQHPAYLPDGRIGFIVEQAGPFPGNADIWIINADGTGAINATNTPAVDENVPAWQ
jgi:dipeptidyl aminopeptidase/acylaminoacyl peptidase